MGTGNDDAGFRWTIGGFWGAVSDGKNDISGVVFNFTLLDNLARGLHGAKVSSAHVVLLVRAHRYDQFKPSKADFAAFLHQKFPALIIWMKTSFTLSCHEAALGTIGPMQLLLHFAASAPQSIRLLSSRSKLHMTDLLGTRVTD